MTSVDILDTKKRQCNDLHPEYRNVFNCFLKKHDIWSSVKIVLDMNDFNIKILSKILYFVYF